MLCLEMLSDVEITGYEEPPPSPECVDLTREVRSRQRSLLEFASNLPGSSGSGSTLKSPWPVFLQIFKPQVLHKRPVQKTSTESPDELSEEESSSQTMQRKSKPTEKMSVKSSR